MILAVNLQETERRENQPEKSILQSGVPIFTSFAEVLAHDTDTEPGDEQLHRELHALLNQVVEKTGVGGGCLAYHHAGRAHAIHASDAACPFSWCNNEQRILLMGQPLDKPEVYVHPINKNERLFGLICLSRKPGTWGPMSANLVQAYARLAAQHIEMQNTQDDLTKYANSLLEKKEELEKIQQYNQNLLSITTHDLSSPLNAVSGYLDMIDEQLKLEDNTNKMKSYYKRIQSGVNDVSEMLGQLDEVIKYKKGFLSLDTVKINAAWLVEDVCEVLKANAEAKEITLQVSTPKHPVFVYVDVIKFKRVIYNLVSNAIKYTEPLSLVQVGILRDKEQLKLYVKDEGVGIADDKLEVIFEPFVKLNDDKEHSPSKGLGLYISSYFVDLMGGEIEVRSTSGEGSIFTVTMPLAPSPANQFSAV